MNAANRYFLITAAYFGNQYKFCIEVNGYPSACDVLQLIKQARSGFIKSEPKPEMLSSWAAKEIGLDDFNLAQKILGVQVVAEQDRAEDSGEHAYFLRCNDSEDLLKSIDKIEGCINCRGVWDEAMQFSDINSALSFLHNNTISKMYYPVRLEV